MDAVILNGPYRIEIERRPKPVIQEPKDAVVKVVLAGICGSELHGYRGHQKTTYGHVMGHEFVGIIEEIGSEVKDFKVGQRVVCTFSTVCGSCWFCRYGYTNRCSASLALGTAQIDGGQSEYTRVPNADLTLIHAPDGVEDELLILMSDILPTGYYGAIRAIETFKRPENGGSSNGTHIGTQETNRGFVFEQQRLEDAIFVCLGCGPVGQCAILTAVAKGVKKIYCVDSVDERLELAAKLGGIPLKLGQDDIKGTILGVTEGRGADAVIEVVGNEAALRSAFDILRPCGVLSSIGFSQGPLPFTALECYSKNLNANFGRAPVRAVFDDSMRILIENKENMANFISHRLPLSEAAQGYAIFNEAKARKVVLKP